MNFVQRAQKNSLNETALWETLYTRGHDAARLTASSDGWCLRGSAVYLQDEKPVALNYSLDLNSDWSTRSGAFAGFIGDQHISKVIERDGRGGWTLNGERQRDLQDAVDLDFGFTPATNHPQLRRMGLKVGQSAQITVAWIDADTDMLEPLTQVYRRVSEQAYDYHSPRNSYRETLEIAPNGFVSLYPGLWSMQAPTP